MRRFLFLTFAAAAAIATATQAAPVACPVSQHGKPLTAASLFDGPPEDGADLRPEDSARPINGHMTTWWSLAEIHKQGRQPHLVCEYVSGGKLVLKPGKAVRHCTRLLQLGADKAYHVRSVRCR